MKKLFSVLFAALCALMLPSAALADAALPNRLYIDADEDHIALQFQKEKGDLSVNDSGYKNNTVLGKLLYVYEGIEREAPESKRNRLVN